MTKVRSKKKKQIQPKTRKELRKEKRLKKKENKCKFFSQQKKKPEKPGEFVTNKKNIQNNEILNKNFNDINNDDDEIESDFELSDEEMQNQLNTLEKIVKKSRTITIKTNAKQESSATNNNSTTKLDRFHENQQREKKKQNELQRKMRKRRVEQLKAANEEDDLVIRRLEKKLRIDKHKNEKSVHKMFNDGLDYALELCLPENIEKMYAAAKEAAELEEVDSVDEFEEDMAIALGQKKKLPGKKSTDEDDIKGKSKEKLEIRKINLNGKKKRSKLAKIESKYFKDDFESDISGSDSEFHDDSDGENNTLSSHRSIENESEIVDDDDDDNSIENEEFVECDEEEKSENEHNNEELSEDEEEDENDQEEIGSDFDSESRDADKRIWEDIYGRKRDKEGNVLQMNTGKYIPPHVRARLEAAETVDEKRKEKLERLKKQCKGFLNRLSETNMHKISSEIENIYMNNSRYDVNNTMTKLILEALVSNVLAKERMVLEHSMLIAVLHGNIGSEIGAHFLQVLITRFDELLKVVQTLNVENKELDNIIFLISHLYTFKIMQHTLIFEIVNKLVEKLCEKTVECILLILRSVGFQLRKEDPGALKDLILSIQKKANLSPLEIKENPRLKFMLEVLNAIKNNNVNKIPNYDPSLAEHLKKILKSMFTGGKYIATLNITLEDLLRVDEKGRWWVVGSAWTGNIKDICSANKTNNNSKNESEKFSEKLLTLARQQRMNTEDRKNVFCIIMSAEDYVDAFERLLHLAIKDHRVIPSIIIHCCLSEKTYNPYYSVLGQKFCEHDRKYQLAVQFALWDKIKDIHSFTKVQITNLGQFIFHLINNGGLPISVLKVVNFAEIDKITLRLIRQIMLGILMGKEDDCQRIFTRIAPSTKLNLFKDSIRLFMHHFLLKGNSKNHATREQMDLLKSRIAMVDTILSYIDSRVKF